MRDMNETAAKIDSLSDVQRTVLATDSPVSTASTTGAGILPYQAIKEMLNSGEIRTTKETERLIGIDEDQIQPASIDLRLGYFAYPVDASFLPGPDMTVLEKMRQLDEDAEYFKIDLRNGAVLERGRVYVIPLLEEINLKSRSKNEVKGFANPKSS